MSGKLSNIWFFEQVDLFDMLCPHKFADFEDKHEFRNYKKGEFVYFEQDASKKIYLIAHGKIKIAYYKEDGREVVKAILSKGEIFGELALIGEENRSDFAEVLVNDTVLCPMDIETAQLLMLENKTFSLKINKLIRFQIKKLERRIDLLVFKDVKTRLLEFFIELIEERGKFYMDFYETNHNFTQKDIADLIGTSRQTVTTLMNELKDDNIIDFSRNTLRFNKLDLIKDRNKTV